MRRAQRSFVCARAAGLATAIVASACTGGNDVSFAAEDAGDQPADAPPHVYPTADAPAAADAGDGRGDAGPAPDAGPPVLHACVDFVDRRALDADRTVRFDSSPSLAYTPPCMLVATGQVVAFEGPFFRHALAPGRSPRRVDEPDGSPDNPIPSAESGTRAEATFLVAGVFPFYCSTHDLAGMVGVVRVE